MCKAAAEIDRKLGLRMNTNIPFSSGLSMFTFQDHFHGLVTNSNIYQIKMFLSMCGSRKYPYHPHRRDLPYDPHSPLDFPKSVSKV